MTQASYNDIAQWYDQFLRERPVYTEVILPNLLALVGEVEGEVICDLACGQGWVARELARRGAQVTGLDVAPNLLALARRYEEQEPLGIVYVQGDAQRADHGDWRVVVSGKRGAASGCLWNSAAANADVGTRHSPQRARDFDG